MEATTRDPDYAPYADGPGGPFRWRLGLRPLDLADWIEIGDRYEAELALKREVQARFADTVFTAMPEAHDACAEVLDALVEHLTARFPDDFSRDGDGAVVNHRLGVRVELGDGHPLEVASRLVQEDLIVMIPHGADGELVFAAGSVCFPNRWDLASKIGLPLSAVHAPVSRLNEQIGGSIDGFFARLGPERSFWRMGWGLLDTDDLYQPLDGTAAPPPTDAAVGDLVVRVERETLRRFPRTGAVLFTIRTYTRRLVDLIDDEHRIARIVEAVGTMPDDIVEYKGLEQIRSMLADLFDDS